ncbi:hypothetical protein L2E82_00518 [Cichorium intybus]|uniref:Uncharacterized protein n=1 Tax=Cichorium intybus TaxID=13427 RepID=A0ACB9GY02_CICIN|nr:hypothetical protein L2E82_00518 [Cichorium intybus]
MNSLIIRRLVFAMLLLNIPFLKAQSPTKGTSISSRFLDSVLQDYAFRSFSGHRQRTGVIYDGIMSPEFSGITVSALRLRSGRLRRKGYYGYKEFEIPGGVFVSPYVERLVLVYQNLGNWSSVYYPLPGYLFLSPVVGLLAYNASQLTAKRLPELDLRASENPILIKFESLGVPADGVLRKCVFFDLFGGVEFDRVLNGSVCSIAKQGHFGIVVRESVPAPAPAPAKIPENPIAVSGGGSAGGGKWNNEWWIGGVVAGVVWVVVVVGGLWAVRGCRQRRRIKKMEYEAEGGVPLAVAVIGSALVPVAMATRTKQVLENEYVS